MALSMYCGQAMRTMMPPMEKQQAPMNEAMLVEMPRRARVSSPSAKVCHETS